MPRDIRDRPCEVAGGWRPPEVCLKTGKELDLNMAQKNLKGRKRKAHRRGDGVCPACGKFAHNGILRSGTFYRDGDGVTQRSADSVFHYQCHKLERGGYLGNTQKGTFRKDSRGEACTVCGSIIEDEAVHVFGEPFHPECKPRR